MVYTTNDNLKKIIEIRVAKWYYKKRKSTHSKVDAPGKKGIALNEHASLVGQTREAFLFVLFSLVEKVQQRN